MKLEHGSFGNELPNGFGRSFCINVNIISDKRARNGKLYGIIQIDLIQIFCRDISFTTAETLHQILVSILNLPRRVLIRVLSNRF